MNRSLPRCNAVLVLALAACCWSAAPALADGSISFGEDDPGEWDWFWEADTGQANVATATLSANRRTVTFTDTGDNTDVTSGTGECSPDADAATIICTAPTGRVVSSSIDAGDGADSITVRGFDSPQIAGGPGGDTITVVPGLDAQGQLASTFVAGDTLFSEDLPTDGADRITTGEGPDSINAQGGNDIVNTGGGTDEVGQGGGSDNVNLGAGQDFSGVSSTLEDGSGDVLEGGPGFDTVAAFAERFFDVISTDAFSSSLSGGFVNATNNGPETNRATGFEDYDGDEGQSGPHVVTGTTGSNRITTSRGNDVINPLGGADQVRAVAGDDVIELRDGFADRADCGNGTDRVSADQLDELIDCEVVTRTTVRAAGADVRAPSCKLTSVKSRYTTTGFAKGLRPRLTCDEAAAVSFTIIARLKARGKFVTSRVGDLVIAQKTVRRGSGARSARVKPSRKFLRRLGKRFKVSVRAEATDEYGNRSAKSKRVTVKAKAKKKRKRKK